MRTPINTKIIFEIVIREARYQMQTDHVTTTLLVLVDRVLALRACCCVVEPAVGGSMLAGLE
jgi:hypothetical protein